MQIQTDEPYSPQLAPCGTNVDYRANMQDVMQGGDGTGECAVLASLRMPGSARIAPAQIHSAVVRPNWHWPAACSLPTRSAATSGHNCHQHTFVGNGQC